MQKRKKIKNDAKTFLEHLIELRNRLLFWLACLFLFCLLGYVLHPMLIDLLIRPLGTPLFYSSPSGGLEVVLNVSLLFGFIVSLPILFYEMVMFVWPAIRFFNKTSIIMSMLASSVLGVVGVVSCYVLVLPPSLRFLGYFEKDGISALISANNYFSFVVRYMISFAIIFQMPLVLWLINFFVKLTFIKLLSGLKWVIVIAFVFSAVLTPSGDVVNQFIVASPIVLLYCFSVIIIFLVNRR